MLHYKGKKKKYFSFALIGLALLVLVIVSSVYFNKNAKKNELIKSNEAYSNFVSSWFNKIEKRYTFVKSFECASYQCERLKIYSDNSFDSLSLVDRYDTIFTITANYGNSRMDFVLKNDVLKLESYDEKLIIVTDKGEYTYDKSFTDIDGKKYSAGDIGKIRKPEPEQVKKINVGMTADEVKKILGEPDEVLYTQPNDNEYIRYRWFFMGNGYVYFANDKVWQVTF